MRDDDRNYYRGMISLWFVILGFWTYELAGGWISANWTTVGAAAFWIAFSWHEIWTLFDRSREDG